MAFFKLKGDADSARMTPKLAAVLSLWRWFIPGGLIHKVTTSCPFKTQRLPVHWRQWGQVFTNTQHFCSILLGFVCLLPSNHWIRDSHGWYKWLNSSCGLNKKREQFFNCFLSPAFRCCPDGEYFHGELPFRQGTDSSSPDQGTHHL